MKSMSASRTLYDNPEFEDTEFALSISPCPRIEEPKGIGANTQIRRERIGADRRRQPRNSRQSDLDDDDLTETLTIGWAIALAIAVALVVYVSGG